MKHLLLILITFIPIQSKELVKIHDDVNLVKADNSLLQKVMWKECRGCRVGELKAVIDCVKNRLNHPKYPKTLDSVLLQKSQFAIDTSIVVKEHFKTLVDTLFNQPIKYPFIHFILWKRAVKGSWVYKKRWEKIGSQHFAK